MRPQGISRRLGIVFVAGTVAMLTVAALVAIYGPLTAGPLVIGEADVFRGWASMAFVLAAFGLAMDGAEAARHERERGEQRAASREMIVSSAKVIFLLFLALAVWAVGR